MRISLACRSHAGAALTMVGVVLLFFWPAIFAGQALFVRDISLFIYPQRESFVRAVAAGSWPLWDPFSGFGQPLLADPSAQILYPLTWINLIVRPWTFYTILVVVQLVFSAVGVYALGQRLGVSRGGSLASSVLWTASGPLLSFVNVVHHFTGATWIPWVLLAADVAVESRRISHVLLWGAAVAGQILAGSADVCAMTALLTGAYVLRRAPWHRALALAALAWGFGLALSAAQWLPTLDVASRSVRADLPSYTRTYWSVHPLQMAQALLPVFPQSLPLQTPLRELLYESREPFLVSVYLGIPAFGLAMAAFAPRRRPLRLFFLFTGLAAAGFALGKHGPLYGVVTTLLPPLRILRYPSKAMIVVSFAFALLAGMGFDAWTRPAEAPRVRWLLAVVAPLAVLAVLASGGAFLAAWPAEAWAAAVLSQEGLGLSYPEVLAPTARGLALAAALGLLALTLAIHRLAARTRPEWFAAVLAVLAFLDLWAAHRGLNPTAPPALLSYRPPTVSAVGQKDLSRLYVYDYWGIGGRSDVYLKPELPGDRTKPRPKWPHLFAQVIFWRTYLFPPLGVEWDLYSSYDVDQRGLYPAPLSDLTLLLRRVEGEPPLHLRLLKLGAVSQVLALHTERLQNLVPQGEFDSLSSRPIRLFGVPDPLPRAYAVGGARVADGSEALRVVLDPGFDPTREVLLSAGAPAPVASDFSGRVVIAELKPDRVRLEVDLSHAGYVVLVDAWDPGWIARVDGREAPVLRANVAFRAVAVPAGRHVIEQAYRPRPVFLGLAVSVAAVLGGMAAAYWKNLGHSVSRDITKT